MTGCDTLVPTGKWTACDKIEQLEGMRLLRRGDCCAHSLPVKIYDLYKWTEQKMNSNLGLQHLVEVFYAVLCHAALMYLEEQSGRAGGAAADEIGATSAQMHGRGAVWHGRGGDEHGHEGTLFVVVVCLI